MHTPTILITEDEALIAFDLQQRLVKLGYQVQAVVPSGEEAIRRAEHSAPDLLLMDIQLKGDLDGIEAAEQIRSFCDVPVIFLTANSDAVTWGRAKATAAASFLIKPFRERELQISIEMALNNHALRRELRQSQDILEERVRQRTAELAAANAALQKEVREREQAEEAASQWKQRYDMIVASSGQAVYDVDVVNRSIVWGAGVERVLGHSSAALNQTFEQWAQLIHPEDRDSTLEAMKRSQGIGAPFALYYRFQHGSGYTIWIHDRGFFLRDNQGRVMRMLGMMQDVTHRKLAEDRIREQAALLDQSQDAIMVRDLENKVVYWTGSAERLYGWTLEEALGQSIAKLIQSAGDTLPTAVDHALQTGEWSGEIRTKTKGGKELVVHSRWTLLRDDHGKPRAFLIAHTDLTEKKLLEAKFQRAQRLESIGALASGVAHDLNNVFTPILMASQLLEASVPSAGHKLLHLLQTSARRGSEMVKQVLSFSRGLETQSGVIQVQHLVREMERMARDTFPRDIEVQTHLAADLWLVQGESTPLYQVLMNLTINARDAMPEGGVLQLHAENFQLTAEHASAHLEGKPGAYVLLKVSDSGTGMSSEVRARIFEPFFTTKEPGLGTGLGLSTVLDIVKSHQGWIEVDTEVGRGTCFSVFLPAHSAPELAPQTELVPPPEGKGELLLIVDDEAAIREILKTTLEAHGYEVLVAANGNEAIAQFTAHSKDIALVITDWAMPVLDGAGTLHALRKLDPEVNLLVLSGVVDKEALLRASKKDGFKLLSKPYSTRSLLTTIHPLLCSRPGNWRRTSEPGKEAAKAAA